MTLSRLFIASTIALGCLACSDESDESRADCPDRAELERVVARYGEAWNEPDPQRRGELLAESVAPELSYVDPLVDTATAAELSTAIADFQRGTPGAFIVQTSEIDARCGELRFAWDFRVRSPETGAEQSVIRGLDYVEVGDDERLLTIRGYWDPIPTEPPDGALADYVAAWTDSAARDRLSSALSDNARFTSAGDDVRSSRAITEFMATQDIQSVRALGVQRYPKFARITLELAGESAPVTDYLHLDEAGRITRIARFTGSLTDIRASRSSQ